MGHLTPQLLLDLAYLLPGLHGQSLGGKLRLLFGGRIRADDGKPEDEVLRHPRLRQIVLGFSLLLLRRRNNWCSCRS